jgi:hypothetical protein
MSPASRHDRCRSDRIVAEVSLAALIAASIMVAVVAAIFLP